MQLVAYGAQDVYLTGNPQITFFKVAYRRHTNFAMQAMTVVASGASGFDKVMNFTIPRNGDLIMNTYLKAEIKDVPAAQHKYAFVKRLGHALVDYATLTIGGSQIDKHYGMWLDLWYELTHKKSQEKGYKQMIGEVPELTKMSAEARKGYTLFVPLQFWFCRNPGLALPLIALQYHEVKVELKTARKDELVCYEDGFLADEAFKSIELGDVSLLVNYVYLDSEERRKFAQVGHEYLIEQLQFTGSVPVPASPADENTEVRHSVQLNFNHPSKELVWAVRNGLTRGKKFVAYTAEDDWSAALDEAADNIMAKAFVSSDAAVADDASKYYFVSAEGKVYEKKDDAESEAPVNQPVIDMIVSGNGIPNDKIALFRFIGKYGVKGDLLSKIKTVEVVATSSTETAKDENGADTETTSYIIDEVNVFTHELTIQDASIPADAFHHSDMFKKQIVVNVPFNYGAYIDGSVNPVSKALLQFNGQDRFDEREGMFFNCVQPLQHHTCTPADGVNVYSFAINPENHQPSGTANLSRIDTTYLQLKYKNAPRGYYTADSQLFVFDFSYNVLRVMSGMGGLAYSN